MTGFDAVLRGLVDDAYRLRASRWSDGHFAPVFTKACQRILDAYAAWPLVVANCELERAKAELDELRERDEKVELAWYRSLEPLYERSEVRHAA